MIIDSFLFVEAAVAKFGMRAVRKRIQIMMTVMMHESHIEFWSHPFSCAVGCTGRYKINPQEGTDPSQSDYSCIQVSHLSCGTVWSFPAVLIINALRVYYLVFLAVYLMILNGTDKPRIVVDPDK
jgi:hypothetical protein